MYKISLIFAFAIILVHSTKIGIYVTRPLCLAEGLEKNGIDLKRFFVDEYDCKQLEGTIEMKKAWQHYAWCSGDYKNGTCEPNFELMKKKSTFGDFEYEVAEHCFTSITTKDVLECTFEVINCFLPLVHEC